MPVIYFDASYAGIDLLVSQIDTDSGRDIAVQSPSRGDRHVLQDRGLKLSSTSATILFIPQAGKDPYTDRFDQFRSIAEGGDSAIFSHPLIGSYQARISDFRFSANAEELMITVTCTIIAEKEPQVVFQASAGVSTAAGLQAVSAASDEATSQLTALGVTSSLPTDCLDTVTDWLTGNIDDLDTQQVFLEVASLTGEIRSALDTFDLASDINRWPAYQALVALSYEVQRAAETATSAATNVFDVTITTPRPLLAICAEIYGPALAQDRASKSMKINRIRTPGRVPVGTYKFPSDGARP